MEKNPKEQQQQPQTQEAAQGLMAPIVKPTETVEFLMSPIGQEIKKFELVQRMAQVYASSTIVPASYQGMNNIGNVIIAIDMAERMGLNPLQTMQNLFIVHGNPGWSSKFLIASFNTCGRFEAIGYEFVGAPNTDQWGARAYSYSLADKDHVNKLIGPLVTIATAKKEGWYSKSGSKWQTIPELMLRYRSAAWFINTTAPEISMGLRTAEELEDMNTVEVPYEEVPQPSRRSIVFNTEPTAETAPEKKEPEEMEEKAAPKRASKNREDLFN